MSHYIALVAGRDAGQQIANRQEGKRGLHRRLGRWDWFQPGGRFAGVLAMLPGRGRKALARQRADRHGYPAGTVTVLAKDIDIEATLQHPWSVYVRAIVQGGRWTDLGVMGWWGIPIKDMAERTRQARIRRWLRALPANMPVTVLDCHV